MFTVDNPARQFESGQPRGGKFSCVCGVQAREHTTSTPASPLTLEKKKKACCCLRGMAKHEYGFTCKQNLIL